MDKTQYLLICLMEEAAEIQQIASKCLRFGLDNYHPNYPDTTNAKELSRELVDLDAIRFMLVQQGAIPKSMPSMPEQAPKIEKVRHYMRVSERCGTLKR